MSTDELFALAWKENRSYLVDLAFRSVGIGVVRNRAGVLFVAEEFMVTQPPAAAPARPVAARAPAVKAPAAKAVTKVVKKTAVRVNARHRTVAPTAKRR